MLERFGVATKTRLWAALAVAPVLALVVGSTAASAQSPAGAGAAGGTPSVLPQPDFHFSGKVGRTYRESDRGQFPPQPTAPKGAPNIVVIMLDDVGFGQYGTFGGAIPSPALDRLAAEGLRFNRFHTTAICSSTRAALLTGRNSHSAASGVITEVATGFDGYSTVLPRSTGVVAEVLRQNGYMTAMIGKNHNTPTWETSVAGPFDRWPNGLGFDYFYGFHGGETDQFHPVLYENHSLVRPSRDPAYHLTEDLADHAISWVRRVKSIAPDRPYFLYVATGAAHAPHQAPREWTDRFRGKFDGGWDRYRQETFERQKRLGVIPADAKLTPRPEGLPAWDSLEPRQKRVYARMMEVFAGFSAHAEHHMGRILDAVRQVPGGENTLVVYIVGDNGASAEGGLEGTTNENLFFNGVLEKWQDSEKVLDELGGPRHHGHFPAGWAHAMNTPFKWMKRVPGHFGGTRNPLILSWPGHIREPGGLRSQFTHVIDVVPTLYELAGITPPSMLNGIAQKPLEGVSFAYALNDAKAPDRHVTQYFELSGRRGIYREGWIAATAGEPPWNPRGTDPDTHVWELYDLTTDFTQAVDLAPQQPRKLRELQDLWWSEAARYGALPLDWRAIGRFDAAALGRPSTTGNRTQFVYYPGQVGLPNEASPRMLNRSWTVTADIDVPKSRDAEGMIVTQGGVDGGYGLYVHQGRPTVVYNYLSTQRDTLVASQPLPAGHAQIRVDFDYHGGAGELGRGATISLSVNGQRVGSRELTRTIPLLISLTEGLDVGEDNGSPIDFTYELPFRFTGRLDKVTVDLK